MDNARVSGGGTSNGVHPDAAAALDRSTSLLSGVTRPFQGVPRYPPRWNRGLYGAARDASCGHRQARARRGRGFPSTVTATRRGLPAHHATEEQHPRVIFMERIVSPMSSDCFVTYVPDRSHRLILPFFDMRASTGSNPPPTNDVVDPGHVRDIPGAAFSDLDLEPPKRLPVGRDDG